ncbi:hypothetical protein BGW42_000624 [Actinomortierella wolfii]|nr:hypothetical protein BGW42_000624 [Actinomortierella wolfii]
MDQPPPPASFTLPTDGPPRKNLMQHTAKAFAASTQGNASGKGDKPKRTYTKKANKKPEDEDDAYVGPGRGGAKGAGGGRRGKAAAAAAAAAGGGGGDASGPSGRHARDSEDENEEEPEVAIEEQFILRLPPGEMCDRFREKVTARELDDSLKLVFKDPRRGLFSFEGKNYPAKLMDLPTIIESQKTLNGKQLYKIADISQILIVEPTEVDANYDPSTANGTANINDPGAPTHDVLGRMKKNRENDYSWPDGLTNPLKNVRKRRFRKRLSKKAIEVVEQEIERLLNEDALAEEVQYELQMDGVDRYDTDEGGTPAPGGQSDMDMDEDGEGYDDEDDEKDLFADDLEAEIYRSMQVGSDEEEEEEEGTPASDRGPSTNVQTSGPKPSDSNGAAGISTKPSATSAQSLGTSTTTAGGHPPKSLAKSRTEDMDEDEDEAEEEGDEEDEDEDEEEEEDDDDEDDESGSDEEEEEGDTADQELHQLEKLLKEEIRDLDTKIQENQTNLSSAPNPILKKRFEGILENLRKERGLKTMQLNEVKEKMKPK